VNRRIVVAALASLLCSALPIGSATALPSLLPANVEVSANYAGTTDGPTIGSGNHYVRRDAGVDPPGVRSYARSRAIAIAQTASTPGYVAGLSDVSGSPLGATLSARSQSNLLEYYEVLGSGRVDFDLFASIDGRLAGGNKSTARGSTANASVHYHVDLLINGDPNRRTRLFTADANYVVGAPGVEGLLTFSGAWDASAFTFSANGTAAPDSYIEQKQQVLYSKMFGRAFTLDAGTIFALELVLNTGADATGASGLAARSNFLETDFFRITTEQDGEFRPILAGDLPPIPEPGTATLVSIGLFGLATLGGRVGRS
jgi:hypothetical protein